jgi:ParB family chromosome partitioning protein
VKVEEVTIKSIKVGDRFREDMGDLTHLIDSIKEKGIVQPLTISTKKELVAGERRLRAAQEAGLKKVPVIIRRIISELDSREIELIENAARKDFTWVERANLEKRIFELKKEVDPNWSERDQAALLEHSKGAVGRRLQLAGIMEAVPELADCKTEDEAWKKYKKLEEEIIINQLINSADDKYKEAAKWANDHYKIGDAFKGMKKVNAGIIGFVEVDPPYAVELEKRKSRNQDLAAMDRYNEVEREDYPEFVAEMAKECFRTLKLNTFCVWWFGQEWYTVVLEQLIKAGFSVNPVPAIWVKGEAGQTASPDTMLASSYEPFFVARKGQPKLRKAGRSNVFSFKPVAPQAKIHPTERPLDLMVEIVETFAYPGTLIACPFMGSGVTLRAAYKNKMTGFGWDYDEVAKRRFVHNVYKDMSGVKEKENE